MRQQQSQRDWRRTGKRAISDLLGFSLMFSIIILGVGAVSIGGLSQLNDLSDVEEVRSAERGMESAGATLEAMNRQSDPKRSFTLALKGGNVWVNQTSLSLEVGSLALSKTVQINSLQHRFDRPNEDITIRYEGGGVFRTNAATARYQPSFRCRNSGGDTTAIVNVVNLTLADSGVGLAIGKGFNQDLVLNEYSAPSEAPIENFDEGIQFRANVTDVERSYSDTSSTVTIDVEETADPESWQNYFDNTAWSTGSNDDEFECSADRALIRVTTIRLEVVTQKYTGTP